jgi:hypothetical protein
VSPNARAQRKLHLPTNLYTGTAQEREILRTLLRIAQQPPVSTKLGAGPPNDSGITIGNAALAKN